MSAAAETAIAAEGVEKSFGRTRVLRALDLRVDRGETLAVFGPNGAGKSTLLRMCAGLSRPTGGTLRLFDSDGSSAALRRRIGLVAHASMLYLDLSARENLAFYGRLYGVPHTEAAADAWLARVGLAHAASRPVRVFSRGMEQRLALARALLHDPDLVVLDEPWSGLDAAGTAILDGMLTDLRRAGRTIVVATHDLARGLALADRAVILHDGRVACEATGGVGAFDAVDAAYRRITGAVAA